MTAHPEDPRRRALPGLVLAAVSAATFGLSGSVASRLIDAGWSPTAAVVARLTVAALVLLLPTVGAVRARGGISLADLRAMTVYGLAAMAATQLGFFLAVTRLPVATALLIEYLAPVAVLGWMWLRHGRQPSALTGVGAALALGGLFPVLGVGGGRPLDPVGVGFGLIAMTGLVCFFVISADESSDLPAVALTCGGAGVAAALLAVVGMTGLLPWGTSTAPALLGDVRIPWGSAVLVLGVVSGAVAYLTGIGAARLLGARTASFVGLSEVLFAAVFAGLLLGQQLTVQQVIGGVVVLVGVALVQLGDGPSETVPTSVGADPVPVGLGVGRDAPRRRVRTRREADRFRR